MMHKKTKPTKKMMAGGMMKKGYAAGGAMPMKDGKPAFIGDGKGKMAAGGMAKKGYQAGGVMDEEEMMGRMGRGMAKATMEEENGWYAPTSYAVVSLKPLKSMSNPHPFTRPVLSRVAPPRRCKWRMAKKMMAGGGMTKKMMAGGGMTKKMQAGGGVTRGDGIIKKGRTQGKMI
jgi:hypothetical protein